MKYRFIGQDGSMGYRNGKVYRVVIVDERYDGSLLIAAGNWFTLWSKPTIPYNSKEAFERNWQKV